MVLSSRRRYAGSINTRLIHHFNQPFRALNSPQHYLLDAERCIIITEFLHEHILLRTALCADGSPASRAGRAAADVGAFMGAVRIQPG